MKFGIQAVPSAQKTERRITDRAAPLHLQKEYPRTSRTGAANAGAPQHKTL
jgi:hypothetical protein